MRIAICVKQVPAASDVQIDRQTKRLRRDKAPAVMNECDRYALELALRLREENGASITAFSMGPPQAARVLKECLALGAERACLLCDAAFAGSDTYATAHILAKAIRRDEELNGKFDLILCGKQSSDGDTAQVGEELASQYAVVVDLGEGTILAQKSADAVISPASMTKILTVLVAAEEVADHGSLDDTVVIDFDITNYCYLNECSVAGFLKDEAVTVRDLFYGAILPSGADACLGLAKYVAGSQEDFVVLMNEKVEELGLSGTAHFANCIGLYDDANTCTVYDMAMILKAALDNELCRQVLTTKVYEIPASEAHPEGMVLSNWFLRKIEDHVPEGLEVLGAKTGFVDESGSCAASYAQLSGGGEYICVTGNAFSSWRCIKDHVQLYTTYLPGLEPVLE